MPHSASGFVIKPRIFTFIPALVLILCLLLTWSEVANLRQQETNQIQSEFNIRANELATSLMRRVVFHADILRGVAGLFSSSNDVSRDEFHHYVDALQLSVYHRGIQGIGYSPLIPKAEITQHIAAVRAEGFPDYRIVPPGDRPIYSSILYIEPLNWRSRRVMGFDMLVEPIRRQAAEQARDTASAVMTDKILLKPENNELPQPGVIIFLPVYHHDMPTSTIQQRREALVGWVYGAIELNELLNHFLTHEYSNFSQKIALRLYSGNKADPAELMIDTTPANLSLSGETVMTRNLQVLGTNWTLQVTPLPAYWDVVSSSRSSNIVMSAGVILSLLSAFLSYVVVNAHLRITKALTNTEQANINLAEREALLRAIYDTSSVAVLLIGTDGEIIYTNQRVAELFKQPFSSLQHQNFYQLLTTEQKDEFIRSVDQLLTNEYPAFSLEQRFKLNDHNEFIALSNGQPFRNKTGQIIGIVIVINDITEQRKNEEAMQLASIVLEASPGGIMVTDADKRIITVNPAFTRITGYSLDEVLYQSPSILSSGQQNKDFYKTMWHAIEQNGHWEGEIVNRKKDGQLLPELLSISRVLDRKGNVVNYVGLFLDISERWEAETRIQYLAHHDYLTGLPNRLLLVERATQALNLARRYNRRLAILFIDLDRFKPINDEYGHSIGDDILKIVAQRLLKNVRESDTVCRQGGDEFVILLPEFNDAASLENLAIKLRDEIRQPCQVNGYQLTVSASIGIASYPDNGDSVDAIIQSADTAMYRAKANCDTHICFARYLSAMRPTQEI